MYIYIYIIIYIYTLILWNMFTSWDFFIGGSIGICHPSVILSATVRSFFRVSWPSKSNRPRRHWPPSGGDFSGDFLWDFNRKTAGFIREKWWGFTQKNHGKMMNQWFFTWWFQECFHGIFTVSIEWIIKMIYLSKQHGDTSDNGIRMASNLMQTNDNKWRCCHWQQGFC